MLVCWLAGTNDLSTKHLMFQVLYFFTISCKFFYKNCINLFFLFDPANQRTRVLYCRLSDFYFWLLPLQWKWHCLAPLHIWFTPNIWTGAELKPKDIDTKYSNCIDLLWVFVLEIDKSWNVSFNSTVEMTLLGSLAYMIHSKYLDWSRAKAQRYKY